MHVSIMMATPKLPLLVQSTLLLVVVVAASLSFKPSGVSAETCNAGYTGCYELYTDAFRGCYDLVNDTTHCGDCVTTCPTVSQGGYGTCVGGTCPCQPGYTFCRYWRPLGPFQINVRVCTNLTSDNENCGVCGTACPHNGPCTNGRCFPCPPGYTKCTSFNYDTRRTETYCAKLDSDTQNCGLCGNMCGWPEGVYCWDGRCSDNEYPPTRPPPPPSPPSPSPPSPRPPTPPPPPPYFAPTSWLPVLLPVNDLKSLSPLTTSFTANGGAFYTVNATKSRPESPTASAYGYGPCPYWTKYGIKPSYKLPVTDIITLATNNVTQATSFYTSSALNLTRPTTAKMASFAAEFFFQLTPNGCIEDGFSPSAKDTDTCGSGFVFTLQSLGKNAVGYWGPDLGYGNITAPAGSKVAAVSNSVAVEFDFKLSSKMNENDGNHIGVLVGGSPKHTLAIPASHAKIPQNLADGNIKHVVIFYNANTKILQVHFSDDPSSAPRLVISYPLDVRKYVDVSRAYFGFTAATGILPNVMNLKVYNFRLLYAPYSTNPTPLPSPSPAACTPPSSAPAPSPTKAPAPSPIKVPAPSPTSSITQPPSPSPSPPSPPKATPPPPTKAPAPGPINLKK